MRQCLSACTLPGTNYPAFLSINTEEDGGVEFMVRPSAMEDGRCGEVAAMKMSWEDFCKVVEELHRAVTAGAHCEVKGSACAG